MEDPNIIPDFYSCIFREYEFMVVYHLWIVYSQGGPESLLDCKVELNSLILREESQKQLLPEWI